MEAETEVIVAPQIENETVNFKLPIIKQLQEAAANYRTASEDLKIFNSEDFVRAGAIRDAGAKWYKIFWELLNEPCRELDQLHSKACGRRDAVCSPYKDGSAGVKKKMIAFEEEQERIRQREQARLDAERKQKDEADRREIAALLEQAGQTEAAEEVIEHPAEPEPVILPKSTPKVEGFSYRSNWTFEIECGDCKQWVRSRDAQKQHNGHNFIISEMGDEYKLPDFTKIGVIVGRMKRLTKIPGIRVIEEKV